MISLELPFILAAETFSVGTLESSEQSQPLVKSSSLMAATISQMQQTNPTTRHSNSAYFRLSLLAGLVILTLMSASPLLLAETLPTIPLISYSQTQTPALSTSSQHSQPNTTNNSSEADHLDCSWPSELGHNKDIFQTTQQIEKKYLFDWIPADDLTHYQSEMTSRYCQGGYIQPPINNAEGDLQPDAAHIVLQGDNIHVTQGRTAKILGNVSLTQGFRQARADSLTYFKEENRAELTGDIRFREPNILLQGDNATIDLNAGEVVVENSHYIIHNARTRGSANSLKKTADNKIILKGGSYTRCPPDSPMWEIRAGQIELDQTTGYGTTTHMRLYLKDTPVFYAPYLKFPIDGKRHSGLLFPTIGSTESNGIDFAIPYYFNISPNSDATYTPRYMNTRGYMHEGEVRYLNTFQESTLGATYLQSDPETNDEIDRWLLSLDQKAGDGKHWQWQVDYTAVSDNDYFEDLNTTALDVENKTHLKRMAKAAYYFNTWTLSTTFEQYQTTEIDTPNPYRLLPEIVAEKTYQNTDTNLNIALASTYSHFNHTNKKIIDTSSGNIINTNRKVDGKRLHTVASISWPYEGIAGYITPSTTLYHTKYHLEDPNSATLDDITTTSPDRTLHSFSLDSGLFFERKQPFHLNDYIQTLEPRAFYLYTKAKDQLAIPLFDTDLKTFNYSYLFSENRFNGYDRIGDANQLSLGLSTRFIEEKTGKERLRANIGQIFYLNDREVNISNDDSGIDGDNNSGRNDVSNSLIAAELSAPLSNKLSVISTINWDSRDDQIEKGRLDFRYNQDSESILNFGYQFTRKSKQHALLNIDDSLDGLCLSANGATIPSSGNISQCNPSNTELVNGDLEQASLSFVLPFRKHWTAISSWSYDLTHHRTLDVISGVEYNDCCWKVQLFTRRELDDDTSNELISDYDNGVFLTFQFKGLGGAGNGIQNTLNKTIVGYKERDLNEH